MGSRPNSTELAELIRNYREITLFDGSDASITRILSDCSWNVENAIVVHFNQPSSTQSHPAHSQPAEHSPADNASIELAQRLQAEEDAVGQVPSPSRTKASRDSELARRLQADENDLAALGRNKNVQSVSRSRNMASNGTPFDSIGDNPHLSGQTNQLEGTVVAPFTRMPISNPHRSTDTSSLHNPMRSGGNRANSRGRPAFDGRPPASNAGAPSVHVMTRATDEEKISQERWGGVCCFPCFVLCCCWLCCDEQMWAEDKKDDGQVWGTFRYIGRWCDDYCDDW